MLGRRGSEAGSIFTTGPSITRCQSGRAAATPSTQRDIHPLVDHAEEAEPRMRDRGLVGRIGRDPPRLREVRDVDAARERMDVRDAGAAWLRTATGRRSTPAMPGAAAPLRARVSAAGAPLNADSSSMQS